MTSRRFSDEFNDFLSKNALWICLTIVALILIAVLIIVIKGKKNKSNKQIDNSNDWIIALGDKDNIKEVSYTGSRLAVKVIDKNKINREELTKLGATSVITMSDKITLVVEDKAELIGMNIESSIKN